MKRRISRILLCIMMVTTVFTAMMPTGSSTLVMTLSKNADVSTADPGDTIVYTIIAENAGDEDAIDVVITDYIPEATTFVNSAPSPDSSSGDEYTWNIGILGPSGPTAFVITITVTVDVGTSDSTILHNVAILDYTDGAGNPYDEITHYVDVTVTAPIMWISKTADVTTADPEDPIEYTLYYENTGSGDATGVIITDTIPEDTTFVSSYPTHDFSVGDTYTWNVGVIPGMFAESITITVTVDIGVPTGTLLHNEATLDYNDNNGNAYSQIMSYVDVLSTVPVDAQGPYGTPGAPICVGTVNFQADIIDGDVMDYIFRWDVTNDGYPDGPGSAPDFWGAWGESDLSYLFLEPFIGQAKVEAWDGSMFGGDPVIIWDTADVYVYCPVHNLDTDEYFYEIQTAIDDTDTQDGHEIEVDAGTYNENVVIDKTINLTGEHMDTAIIDSEGSGNVVQINADWVNITGFTITNGSGAGIYIYDSDNCTIKNCNISDNYDGIYLFESSNNTIKDNICNSNYYDGISLIESSSNNTVENNTCNSNTNSNGILVSISSNNNTIAHNNCSWNTLDGIWCAQSDYNRIKNNGFSDNNRDGIRLHITSNNTVENNTCNSNIRDGIRLTGYSNNNTIENNTCNSNTMEGINLSYSEDNEIIDNDISNNRDGIHVTYYSNNITIEDNTCTWNNRDGINLSFSDDNKIIDNDVSNNRVGIRLAVYSDDNTIENNTCNSNTFDGIILYHSDYNEIIDNDVSNNLYGIRFIGYSNENTIENNTCNSNSMDGINLSSSDDNDIIDNDISNNDIGIYLKYSNSNTFSLNKISENTVYGITLSATSNNEFYHNDIIGNAIQAIDSDPANNDWHNTTLLRGNFWSDYNGKDDGTGTGKHADPGDGIGDTLISHPGADYDNYPLMWPTFGGPVRNLDTGEYFDEIQVAIDDTDTLDGHEIEVEAGTYEENLGVDKSINLTGSGKTITIIKGDDTKDVIRIKADWVNLTGFNITNSQSPNYGIYLEGVENCTVKNSELSGNDNMDIFSDGFSSFNNISDNDIISSNSAGVLISPYSNNNTISGNTVKNHDRGIYVRGDNNEIEDNEVKKNNKGIVLQGSDSYSNSISGNTITENTNFGIWIYSSSHHNNITDNPDISNNEYGIKLQSSSNNYITGNKNPGISNNVYGIKLLGSSNNNISDNNITFNTDSNINLSSSSKNNNITNNPLITDSPYGIFIESGSTDNNISGNLHIDDNEFGIYMTNSNSNTVSWNKFNTNPQYGIYVETSDEGEFYKNEIKNGDYGIKYHNSNDLLIVDNDIDCEIENIYDDPSSAIIKGNILRNAIFGIRLGDSNAVITDNIIINCTYGIYCYNSDAVISGNYISNNVYGIYIDHSSPTIEDNTLEDNVYGIFIGPQSDPTINNNTFVNNTYDEYFMVWSIDIDPDTLNLDSEGKWITCYIEATEGIDLNDVDISTIRISEIGGFPVVIPAEGRPTNIGDHDNDGILDLMIKFDRNDVQDVAWPGDIEITITGELKDGTPFEGYYTIRVINPGK